MPVLNWIGKEKIVNHHLNVPFKPLQRIYSFDEKGYHEKDNESENMIIHGDNLEALKSIMPKYEGKIDCIYIDPPYNTGNEQWIYNDNVNDPQIAKWLGEVVGTEGEDLTRHDKWLCMMYPRLQLLHKLLSKTGYIFISVNFKDTGKALRLICDEIFGVDCYVGTLTWESTTQPANAGKAKFGLQTKTEPILLYRGKDATGIFNLEHNQTASPKYPHNGKYGPCRFEIIEKSDAGGYNRPTMKFEILGQKPREGKRWQIGEDTARELEKAGKVEVVDGIIKRAIYPEDEIDKVVYYPFWSHLSAKEYGTAQHGKETLNNILGYATGFDTVKPVELIEGLIQHVKKDAIILDSFAGSGTTAQAVLQANSKDGGNRKFICIELMDYAETITAERIKKVIEGYSYKEEIVIYDKEITLENLINGEELLEEAKDVKRNAHERYSKVGNPKIQDGHLIIKAENSIKTKQKGLKGSFSYYELGMPLFINGSLDQNVDEEIIKQYIYYSETKQVYVKSESDPALIGVYMGTAYYINYDKENRTELNHKYLSKIQTRAEAYVIFADICTLSKNELEKYKITFKKVPRDIRVF